MSDTPRTDAAVFLTIGAGYNSVDPNFARELERENAALRRDVFQCPPTSENDYEGFKWRDACEELERENAALREILINADELERYSGSDGRRQWGKCSTWLHADDVVITVSAKAFDAIRKEAQL